MRNMIKIYKATFRSYTNCLRDTVSSNEKDSHGFPKEYIHLKNNAGELIIKEDSIDHYRGFGGGYETLTFVGFMEE